MASPGVESMFCLHTHAHFASPHTLRATMDAQLMRLYNDIHHNGISAQYCWDLMQIAETLGHTPDTKLARFKDEFNWWGGYEYIWQDLYNECMESLNLF